jgi:hypothetical protein
MLRRVCGENESLSRSYQSSLTRVRENKSSSDIKKEPGANRPKVLVVISRGKKGDLGGSI